MSPESITAEPVKNRGGWREGAGRPVTSEWYERFLAEYQTRGGFYRSAKAADVHPRTVKAAMERDEEFAERVADARELFADTCEDNMLLMADRTGNPVGYIVRLKALRPELYIEKHAVLNVNANVTVDGPDALAVLRQMLGHATPSTQRMILDTTAERVSIAGTDTHASDPPPTPA